MEYLYSDRKSKEVYRERKLGVNIGFFALISITTGYTFLVLSLINLAEPGNMLELMFTFLLLASIIGVFLMVHMIFLKDQMKALKHGIQLNSKYLTIYDKKILLNSIIEANIVKYSGNPHQFLAIIYQAKKRDQTITKFHLLNKNEAKDIFELRDKIFEIKDWPQQDSINTYSWKKWKQKIN